MFLVRWWIVLFFILDVIGIHDLQILCCLKKIVSFMLLLFSSLPSLVSIMFLFSLDRVDNMWRTWWNWDIKWRCANLLQTWSDTKVNYLLVQHLLRCFFSSSLWCWQSLVNNAGDWHILMLTHLSRKCLLRMVNGFLELLKH